MAGMILLYFLSIGPAQHILPRKIYQRVYLPVFWLCGIPPFYQLVGWYMHMWGVPEEIGPGDPSPYPAHSMIILPGLNHSLEGNAG
jgi:hypothetical protein